MQARDIHGGFHVHQAPASIPTPRQLPSAGPLVGRDAELAALDEARASPGIRTAVVSGPAGIGKTALALHWAHRVHADYPDGQLYADLRGHAPGDPLKPGQVLGGFLRALGAAPDRLPADLAELAALYRSLIAERRILVVLDDAISAAQVRPLLPASEVSLAVVTSRWRLTGLLARGARGVQLDRLDEEAALRLLSDSVGPARAAAEPADVRRLARLCGRYPLALSVAGARLAARPHWPVREMADALSQEQGRLSLLSTGEEDEMAVRGAIDLSYRTLTPESARLYRLLGLFPGVSFESRMAAALGDVSRPEALRSLHALTEVNLLRDTAADRYRFHDLIRLHAAMTAKDETAEARRQAIGRMLGWYLATAVAARRAVAPFRAPLTADIPAETPSFTSPDEGLNWMDREISDLGDVVRLAIREGHPDLAWRLVSATWPLFQQRGRYDQRLEFEGLGLEAAMTSGDPEGKAMMLNRVGLALREVGRTEEASDNFAAALALWRDLGRTDRVISSLRRLAIAEGDRGHLAQAIDHLEEALALCRSTPSTPPRTLALAHSDLGAAFTGVGRADEAIALLQEARRLLMAVPDPYNQARVLIRLGRAHGAAGSPENAEAMCAEALGTMREIGSPLGEAEALERLGDVARALGRAEEADRRYAEALDILDRFGSPKAAALRQRLGPRQGGESPAG